MNILKQFIAICILLFSIAIAAQAQPELPPEDEIPIDGGVGFLLAAGAAWGIKKLREKN